MKAQIFDIDGKKLKQIELPIQFNEEIRPDLIKKAVLTIQNNNRQAYGAYEKAGMLNVSKLYRRRKRYRSGYGRGMSRVPRKTMLRRGSQFIWVGATVSGMVGGRKAHPPKSEKDWTQKLNKKERLKSIRSALSALTNKELIKEKGFSYLDSLPLIIEDKIEKISKTKDLNLFFKKFKLDVELERTSKKEIRSGKGKFRGRKYKQKIGPLFIVSKNCELIKSVSNLPGFEIVNVDSLNTELLAPGAIPGRLTIWSSKAIEKLDNEKLFTLKEKPKKIEKIKEKTE